MLFELPVIFIPSVQIFQCSTATQDFWQSRQPSKKVKKTIEVRAMNITFCLRVYCYFPIKRVISFVSLSKVLLSIIDVQHQ